MRLDTKLAEALHEANYSDREIAWQAGCSASAVSKWRHRTSRQRNKSTKYDWDRARPMHASGMTDRQIGEAIGAYPTIVCRWRFDHGLPINRSTTRNGPIIPLPSRMHKRGAGILALAKSGKTYAEIAEALNLQSRNVVAGMISRARALEDAA